jgi:hypothetical protein
MPPLQPAVRDGIRRLTPDDIDALLAIQESTLPDTMAARLGDRFNVLYFRSVLGEPLCFVDGYFVDGRVVGFLAYSPAAAEMLRRVVRHNRMPFVAATAAGLLVSPSSLGVVLRIVMAILARVPETGSEIEAEMLSMGVLADFRGRREVRGRTVRVAHELVQHAFSVLRANGARRVKAFVKLEEADPVARRFWFREGCTLVGRARRFGIEAELLVKDLSPESSE